MVGAIGILALYSYGLFQFTILVLAITAFIGVAAVLGLVGCIATTSPPPPPEPEPSSGENASKKTDDTSSPKPVQ